MLSSIYSTILNIPPYHITLHVSIQVVLLHKIFIVYCMYVYIYICMYIYIYIYMYVI